MDTMARMVGIGLLVVLLALAGCQTGQWSVAGGSNWKTSSVQVLYSPDPNGGLGVRVLSDSVIPEDTDRNVAVGPALEFSVSDVAALVAGRILPGDWLPLEGAPTKLYGTLALLWETDGGDLLFLPGTELRFLPGSRIQPYVRTEYLTPEGSADGLGNELLTTFGAVYRF